MILPLAGSLGYSAFPYSLAARPLAVLTYYRRFYRVYGGVLGSARARTLPSALSPPAKSPRYPPPNVSRSFSLSLSPPPIHIHANTILFVSCLLFHSLCQTMVVCTCRTLLSASKLSYVSLSLPIFLTSFLSIFCIFYSYLSPFLSLSRSPGLLDNPVFVEVARERNARAR